MARKIDPLAKWFGVGSTHEAVNSLAADWNRWTEYPWRHLVAAGADVNATNKLGSSMLHLLVQRRASEPLAAGQAAAALDLLVRAGARVNARDGAGQTPLHLAASTRGTHFVQSLLRRGASATLPDRQGRTPLHTALTPVQFNRSTLAVVEQVVDALLNAGAKADAPDATGQTPVHYLARGDTFGWYWNATIAGRMLATSPAVNTPDSNGDTPLHLAARSGFGELGTMLSKAGADFTHKNKAGFTPLRQLPAEELMITYVSRVPDGALVTNRIPRIPPPFQGHVLPPGAKMDLQSAVRAGDVETMRCYYQVEPSLFAETNGGDALLELAAMQKRKPAVLFLLERGVKADPIAAAAAGRLDLLKEVYSGNPKLTDQFNRCPLLHYAVVGQNPQVVQWLLEQGADASQPDMFGGSALKLARDQPNQEIAALLEQHGASVNLFDAVLHRDVALARKLMKEQPELAKATASNGAITPLAQAFTSLRPYPTNSSPDRVALVELVTVLLEGGASPEGGTASGTSTFPQALLSPLHNAARIGDMELVRLLVKHGANVNRVAEFEGFAALHYASASGNGDLVKLLLEHGANVNAQFFGVATNGPARVTRSGSSPLHVAAYYGDTNIMRLLLEHKADVNATNHFGQTPLTYFKRVAEPGRQIGGVTLSGLPYRSVPSSLGGPTPHASRGMFWSAPAVAEIESLLKKYGGKEGERPRPEARVFPARSPLPGSAFPSPPP